VLIDDGADLWVAVQGGADQAGSGGDGCEGDRLACVGEFAAGALASELLPLADFQAGSSSAEAFIQPYVRRCPSGAGSSADRGIGRIEKRRWSACMSPRCRSLPISSGRVQPVHPDVGWILLPPRCLEDQEGLTAFWRSGL
jgi:hypothetical protein